MSIALGKYLLVLPVLSLLVACAQLSPLDAQNANSRVKAEQARTHYDHANLANYHDILVKEMAAKAKEKKQVLVEYESNRHKYGRLGQDLESHTTANIRYYEQAARNAQREADFHRKIAAELLQRESVKPAAVPGQHDGHAIKAELNVYVGNL